MAEPITKEYLDEQIDTVLRTVKKGFDHVDERFAHVDEQFGDMNKQFGGVEKHFQIIEEDIAHIKERLRLVENEVRALSANMVTKQYLDAKIDQIMLLQQKDSLWKRLVVHIMDEAKILTPETRAKLEALIP
jgi:archaellum component FlaC